MTLDMQALDIEERRKDAEFVHGCALLIENQRLSDTNILNDPDHKLLRLKMCGEMKKLIQTAIKYMDIY